MADSSEPTRYAVDIKGAPICWHPSLVGANHCGAIEEYPNAEVRPYRLATAEEMAEYAGLVADNDCPGGIRANLRDALRRIEHRDIPEVSRG